MSYRVTLIPGDGTGPEVVKAAVRCVDAVADIDWDEQSAGETALKESNSVLPDSTIRSITKNKIALKGPITTPVGGGFRSVNVELRKKFDLYANVRPARAFKGTKTNFPGLDI